MKTDQAAAEHDLPRIRRTPEQAKAVLAARARRLAHRPAPPATITAIDVLAFAVGCERYAIETRHVREVVRAGVLTPVPETADFVLGLTNLRGELVPVVDLRKLLGTATAEATAASPLLILGDQRAELGLLTDAVQDVHTLTLADILAWTAPAVATASEHLRGVTRDGLAILDGASLLATTRLVADAEDEATGMLCW